MSPMLFVESQRKGEGALTKAITQRFQSFSKWCWQGSCPM